MGQIRNPGGIHQPCVVLLDISGSMLGVEGTPEGKRPIDALNRAVKGFESDLKRQIDVNACTEVCIIAFNSQVQMIQPFKNAAELFVPKLKAVGTTSMNEALLKALKIIEDQKQLYIKEEVDYYRPWLFLVSDGIFTDKDKEKEAKRNMREAIEGDHIVYYPVKAGPWAKKDILWSYYPESYKDKVLIIAEEGFYDQLFTVFSNSIKRSIKNSGIVDMNDGIIDGLEGIHVEKI